MKVNAIDKCAPKFNATSTSTDGWNKETNQLKAAGGISHANLTKAFKENILCHFKIKRFHLAADFLSLEGKQQAETGDWCI